MSRMLNKHDKIAQTLKIHQSGDILPNQVTLAGKCPNYTSWNQS